MGSFCLMDWKDSSEFFFVVVVVFAFFFSLFSLSRLYRYHAVITIYLYRYFKLGKLSSFQRQLNLYGFNRITRGPDATGYYHEYFLRDREYLAKRILRKRIKGTKIKGATNPDLEPDFYAMVRTDKQTNERANEPRRLCVCVCVRALPSQSSLTSSFFPIMD